MLEPMLSPGLADRAALDAPAAAIELLPVAAYACDREGRLRWYNRRAAEFWGRSPAPGDDAERFCGSHRLFGLDGAPLARAATPMAQVLRTGRPAQGEAVVERPDGTRRIARVDVAPVLDSDGRVLGAINCLHDVSPHHRAERSALDAENRLRDLLDALPAAIYTTDAEGYVTFFNRAAATLSGRRPRLGLDRWCVSWKLYRPDGTPLPHAECPMAETLGTGRPVRGAEVIAERPDGTRIDLLPHPTPLTDAAGRLIGAVNMLVDISARKQAERRERMMRDELNHRVKNNLQLLHSLLKTAEVEAHSAEARATLADACRRVGAMAATQHVLRGAELPEGIGAAQFLAAVCDNARRGFAADAAIAIGPSLGTVAHDAVMPLALILNELLTNAVKHGTAGRDTVRIAVRLVRDGDGFVLEVADDGPGFEPGPAPRRASGLGLVAGLARQLQGTFEVRREGGARCILRGRAG